MSGIECTEITDKEVRFAPQETPSRWWKPSHRKPYTVMHDSAPAGVSTIVVAAYSNMHRESVMTALGDLIYDWRTPETLSAATGLPVIEVEAILDGLGDRVRNPVGNRPGETHLYRLSSRGRTRGEWWRLFFENLARGG